MNTNEENKMCEASRLKNLAIAYYSQNLNLGLDGIRVTREQLAKESDDKKLIRQAIIHAYENDQMFSEQIDAMRLLNVR